MVVLTSAEKAAQQGNQGGADQGDTTAGHQLYHGELVVKSFPKIKNAGASRHKEMGRERMISIQ